MGEEQRVPCVTPAAGMTHTHTCSQGGAETAGLGSSQQGPEGLHLKATKSNRAGGVTVVAAEIKNTGREFQGRVLS